MAPPRPKKEPMSTISPPRPARSTKVLNVFLFMSGITYLM